MNLRQCYGESLHTLVVSVVLMKYLEMVWALQLLSKILSVNSIRTNILEGLCDCRFQGSGLRSELFVWPSTDHRIDEIKTQLW